jgi:transcriptional regulator with XRE-family HTH domain
MKDHETFYRKVGERIRTKRKARGLSQEGLATAIGLKRPSMSNIEKGRQNILLHTFYDIVETLDAKPTDLLPETVARELIALPDLEAYSEEVRAFVEAGINIAKGGDDGDSKTKN